MQVRVWLTKYVVDQRRSVFPHIIQYVVVQCKSGFGQLNMLWTSTGPILLIKYIVDQRRSDFAYKICCGPAQVWFWFTKYALDQRRFDLAHQHSEVAYGPQVP